MNLNTAYVPKVFLKSHIVHTRNLFNTILFGEKEGMKQFSCGEIILFHQKAPKNNGKCFPQVSHCWIYRRCWLNINDIITSFFKIEGLVLIRIDIQLIEYYFRSIFIEKVCRKCVPKPAPERDYQRLSTSLENRTLYFFQHSHIFRGLSRTLRHLCNFF